jgi:hypothetical protein
MDLPRHLVWGHGQPPKADGQPYLVWFTEDAQGYDVLTWVQEIGKWCQGREGIGEDRYDDAELAEAYYAPLPSRKDK